MDSIDSDASYRLYKSDISYFSGKMEAYLRYKSIPYHPIDVDRKALNTLANYTGIQKMPAIEMAGGMWLFDTTPMIQWFERRYQEPAVLPDDPALKFIALLIEDYADEWLWRPAMWWRWVPRVSRWALGWRIAEEMICDRCPRLMGWCFGHRQRYEWLWGDGVNKGNADQVKQMLLDELAFLEPLFESQPFILGSHPSVADFGYFASMFRHFSNDPDPAEVMRRHGPNTYEWVARMWNARHEKMPAKPSWIWPEQSCWESLLSRIGQDYLPYLHQNAVAFKQGKKRFDYVGKRLQLQKTKMTLYRVWCREVLQQHYNTLDKPDQERVRDLLEPYGGITSLNQDGVILSGIAEQFRLPRDSQKAGRKPPSLLVRMLGQPRN